ncbi:murein hydrolase activator EnvC family protein [Laceyella putida]|uniref:Murein hydrolase activator EnvC family protein n=1 Tax=Laceyella putida TaxID=110101 RepID=A0ABW2RKI6_9BACL
MEIRMGKWILVVSLVVASWGIKGPSVDAARVMNDKVEQKLNKVQLEAKETMTALDRLEQQAAKHNQSVAKIEEKLSRYDEEMGRLQTEIDARQRELARVKPLLKHKLTRMYLQGEDKDVMKLVGADSFGQFLHRLQLLRLIVKNDMLTVNRYTKVKRDLEKKQRSLMETKRKQLSLLNESRKQVERITRQMEQGQGKLTKLKREKERLMQKYLGLFHGGTGRLGFPTTRGKVYWNYGQDRGTHIHKGIDIPRPIGTPIYASEWGVVKAIRYDEGGYGVYVIIQHAHGLETLYAHMWRYQVEVSVGQHVLRGQLIAHVGNNGRSSGPHLHYEVRKDGRPVNPKPYLR